MNSPFSPKSFEKIMQDEKEYLARQYEDKRVQISKYTDAILRIVHDMLEAREEVGHIFKFIGMLNRRYSVIGFPIGIRKELEIVFKLIEREVEEGAILLPTVNETAEKTAEADVQKTA
jgi:hypothetical protein